MYVRNLSKIDLNLLLALHVLLEEGSVSRAAERLFITQPAMSRTLTRLRDTFDDALFVRGPHGIHPTPRALEIKEQLHDVLHNIEQLVSSSEFDPTAYEGEIVLACSEFMGLSILPGLMAMLSKEAPSIAIKTVTRIENQLDHLADGDIDFAIHMARKHYSDDFRVDCLSSSKPILLLRHGHPLFDESNLEENVRNYPFISFYMADREELAAMSKLQTMRVGIESVKSRFETSHLLSAIEVVRSSDHLLAGPAVLRLNPFLRDSIAWLPIRDGGTDIENMLVSHKRTANSGMHQWLRQKILEVNQAAFTLEGHECQAGSRQNKEAN